MRRTSLPLFILAGAFASLTYAATIPVNPGSGTIQTAIAQAAAGDTLVLADGAYSESSVKPTVALTIQAAEGAHPVISMTSRFETKADFTLQGVEVQSSAEAIRMVTGPAAYNVTVRDCRLSGCPDYFIRFYDTIVAPPYVNTLTVDNCLFRMERPAANKKPRGIYGARVLRQLRNLSVTRCTFDGGAEGTGRFIYLGHEYKTLQTLEGTVEIDHCTFYNSLDGRGVYPANLDNCHITNCIFMNPEERDDTNSFAAYGSNSYVRNCLSYNAPVKLSTGATQTGCLVRNPYFVAPADGNFQLFKNSPAVNAGTDHTTLGDPRWGVSDDAYDNSHDPYVPYKQPYSTAPTTSSIKILWQMNDETEPTDALVYYGTDPDHLNQQLQTSSGWNVADEGFVHVVTLTGLQPDTRYYFSVGASATRRFDKVCSTKTAPEPGTAFRIFTISDIHGNACKNWSNMQDFICSLHCDIALMNGDFVSSKGNDRNWNNYFFSPGAPFLSQVPCMSSPGNHETGDPFILRWSSFYDYFHQFPHEGACEGDTIDPRNEAYFHFVYGNADVIMLNINGDPSSPHFLPGSRQYAWADSILNTCTRPWIIICHHVGVHTTGYHGNWADEPRQMGTLFEKYAAQGKHIISLSGDDHSFEHLYKDGVHYLRPGCGRDANYDQQKHLRDYKYSMFYRRVSCFSTLDMSADASSITLTAYDSIGTPFYTYEFLREGETIAPSVNFSVPAKEINIEDSILLRWFTFDPAGDANVSLYYSPTPDATDRSGMTPIVTNQPGSVEKHLWRTRDIFPKGRYYLYALITSGGKQYLGRQTAVVNLLPDTTPPPAPSGLTGMACDGNYCLTWTNPTHLVHLDHLLADFASSAEPMTASGEDGATMSIRLTDGALQCDYTIATAWATASADYIFNAATDMHQTPVLSFRLKGNGTDTDLRIVCKNLSAGHEDWWFTEQVSLANSAWRDINLDMRTLRAFDWYANTDDRNHMEGVLAISFAVSRGEAVSGTFFLDDIRLSGDIYPAPDYALTVVMRKADTFPLSPTDGVEIYRGTAETCTDLSSVAGQTYYYAAFAADDQNNWSAPSPTAQWQAPNATGREDIVTPSPSGEGWGEATKFLSSGHLFILRGSKTYNVLGIVVR